MTNRKRNIRALEIRQWRFCPRQWFLFRTTGRKTVVTPESKRGVEFHLKESRKVEAVRRIQRALTVAFFTGGAICIFWLLS